MPSSPAKVSPEAAEEAYIEAYQKALADGLSKPEARVLAKEARRALEGELATKRQQMGEKSKAYHAAFREAIQDTSLINKRFSKRHLGVRDRVDLCLFTCGCGDM